MFKGLQVKPETCERKLKMFSTTYYYQWKAEIIRNKTRKRKRDHGITGHDKELELYPTDNIIKFTF